MTQQATFAQLSSEARHLALAYAVIFPLEPNLGRMLGWLAQSNIVDLTHKRGKEAVDELVNRNILVRTESGALCEQSWVSGLQEQAHVSTHLERLLTIFEPDPYFQSWQHRAPAAEMHLRCALVSGQARELERVRAMAPWEICLEPNLQAKLPNLPASVLDYGINECLEHAIERCADAATLMQIAEKRVGQTPSLAAPLAFLHTLCGNFTEARDVAEKADASTRASIEAWTLTLRGRDNAAMEALQVAIHAQRGNTRKKLIFPDNLAFGFAALALIRVNKPAAKAELADLLKAAERNGVASIATHLLRQGMALVDNPKHRVQEPFVDALSDLRLLTYGIARAWRDRQALQDDEALQARMIELADRASRLGYAWLSAQAHALVAPQTTALSELGVSSLVSVLAEVAPWEISLKALEQLAFKTAQQSSASSADAERKRLAWVVANSPLNGFEVEAREQQLRKSGWSKGKTVALKRLKEAPEAFPYLSEQDRTVISTIREKMDSWNHQKSFYLPNKGVHALIEHPNVIDATGQPVDVVAVETELLIDELDDQRIQARLEPYPDADSRYHVHFDNLHTVKVLHISDSVRSLVAIVPPEGLVLPSNARPRLLDAVGELTGEVRVHGRVTGTADTSQAVPAASTPIVQLLPALEGLSVHVQVEPIKDSGHYFDPGVGSTTVFARIDGVSVQTHRDLDEEREAFSQLTEAVPLLRYGGSGHFRYDFETVNDCLELIDQLQKADARCLWPQGERYKITSRVQSGALNVSIRGKGEWFEASGELNVNEHHALSLARLMALMAPQPQSRFLELGDGEFLAMSDSFKKQLDALMSVSRAQGDKLAFHKHSAAMIEALVNESHLDTDAAWQDHMERLASARAYDPELPSTLTADLRQYQEEGIVWLARLAHWGVGACLADDMGLGKTLQALALLTMRATQGPALVVVPTSLMDNWQTEARRFAPTLNVMRYHGAREERAGQLDELQPFDVVVTSYGLLQNDIELLCRQQWETLILDEAQAIKNAASQRAKAARLLPAEFRLAITGTPVQNNLMDLHALFSFLNPGVLGTQANFRERFAVPIERDKDAEAGNQLRQIIAPFVLRRTKSEVLDELPDRTEVIMHVELSETEAVFYEALRRQAAEDVAGLPSSTSEGQRSMQVFKHLTRLRLAACHPKLVQNVGIEESSKQRVCMATLTELLGGGHKVLVFSQFVKHLKLIEERLISAEISYQYLDGQTSPLKRAARVRAFQAGEGDVFLISLKAGGTGLNLTAADYVIHLDPWWNPAAEDQASDRAHRIGQTRPVTIYRLVARGTIEEQIVELHRHKRGLADDILQGAQTSARLDAHTLLELLKQAPDPAA